MGIFTKENIKKALENPFVFVVLILLIILTLSQSFALWCFIGGLVAIPVALLGGNSNSTISFFCKDTSWKLKLVDFFSNLLEEHIIAIILISIVAWAFLKYTPQGESLLSFLD